MFPSEYVAPCDNCQGKQNLEKSLEVHLVTRLDVCNWIGNKNAPCFPKLNLNLRFSKNPVVVFANFNVVGQMKVAH